MRAIWQSGPWAGSSLGAFSEGIDYVPGVFRKPWGPERSGPLLVNYPVAGRADGGFPLGKEAGGPETNAMTSELDMAVGTYFVVLQLVAAMVRRRLACW
ncbi:hypothetical protein JCM17478_00740 [Thermopirellula anaerolimosa]